MKIVAIVALWFPLIGAAATQPAATARPNVLFIAIDDLNSCLEGMNGETTVPTPHMNTLAQKGVLFLNAHCAAPACNPSRTGVMSGLAPATTGVYLNSQDWRANDILKRWVTLPQHFHDHGYETRGGGKLYHAATLSEGGYAGFIDPRPWDEYFPSQSRQMPAEVLPARVPANGNKAFYGGFFDWAELDIAPDDMADAKVVAWAASHLSRQHDKTLFLGVGIYRPHVPWYTPRAYFDRHPLARVKLPEVRKNDLDDVPDAAKTALKTSWHQWLVENRKWAAAVQGYYASVSFADDMVGRLLQALERGPLAGNTIVVLWSDNGYHLGQKQHWEKFALWEQTTRVPLIIATPGGAQAGRICHQAVSLLDLYPTLNELCGLPTSAKLDGASLVPLLRDPDRQTGRAVVITQGYRNHAVRSDKWRYIRYEKGEEELYDQVADPKNFTNLAALPGYAAEKRELAKWLPRTDAPRNPTGNAQKRWAEGKE